MVKSIRIRQIHTNTLSCEPLLERTANGELLCVCQCDGTREPDIQNRVYAFHSKDDGKRGLKKKAFIRRMVKRCIAPSLLLTGMKSPHI